MTVSGTACPARRSSATHTGCQKRRRYRPASVPGPVAAKSSSAALASAGAVCLSAATIVCLLPSSSRGAGLARPGGGRRSARAFSLRAGTWLAVLQPALYLRQGPLELALVLSPVQVDVEASELHARGLELRDLHAGLGARDQVGIDEV